MQESTTLLVLEDNKDGEASTWKSKIKGSYGSVTPIKSYIENDIYCRNYLQNITIAGHTDRFYGKACRQPNNNWQIIK